ncbi:BZ3500_MvSof-1268-A1-R1_Chr4-2g07011 [Microbotryum saponariae]|uniref:BZ3500_MvSof-1268-A1-R1_Chr4-2g07011 protein n=1 Tax=Microbotryum saponariae TaxID=289078 RepID=A0A2X0KT96_9BASI|nr:BZ3500_MvSof-1268-A1-R1_Chr4-2g07011 [Microbotryum saponariae]SDA06676.1 BZ3501_MvSof-1269-A2-R1_Chr4-2g06722 [Microbotryum saponariae]
MQTPGTFLPYYDVARFGLNATIILDKIISNAATDDLFSLVADFAHRWFYAEMPSTYAIQLKVILGVFAFETMLFVASLLVRMRVPSGFWIFRWTNTPAGDYITPHFAVSLQIASAFFLLACQAMMWVGTLHAKGRYVAHFTLWQLLPFIPSYLSVWCLSWSLYVAQSVFAHSQRPHWSTSPRVLNVHFCALLAVIPIVIGPSVFADSHYERVYRTTEGLRLSALAYAQTKTLLELKLPLCCGLRHLQYSPFSMDMRISSTLLRRVDRLDDWHRLHLRCESPWILCVIAGRYFAFLRGEFRKVDEEKLSESDPIHRNCAIRSAFWNALLTCVCVTAIGTIFTATTFFLVFATRLVVLNGYAFSIAVISMMWTFAICGFPAGVLSLMRSIQGLPGRPKEALFVFKARSQTRQSTIPSANREDGVRTVRAGPEIQWRRMLVAGWTIHDSDELESPGDEFCATRSGTPKSPLEKNGSLGPASLGRSRRHVEPEGGRPIAHQGVGRERGLNLTQMY